MNPEDLSRLIEMAWEDRTPFDAIFKQYGLTENEVMRLMQKSQTIFLRPLEEKSQRDWFKAQKTWIFDF